MARQHTGPCRECPFRRASAPGWTGEADPEAFLAATLAEARMPCHMQVDYEDEDWRILAAAAALCAGALVFMKNTGKLPRDRVISQAMADVVADPVTVFRNGPEFLAHHA